MQSEFRSTSTQEMFLMFLCNLRSLVWGQFTVKNHSELLKVSCSCSKYLLLLFPPGPFVCVCLQELNATTRYSQRRRAQAEDTQVHTHTMKYHVPPHLFFVNYRVTSFLFLIRAPEKMTNQKLLKFPKMKQISNRYLVWSCSLPALTYFINSV